MNASVMGPPTQTASWTAPVRGKVEIDFEVDGHERLMLDPSVLLLGGALDWLRDPELRDRIVISRALAALTATRRDELARFVDEPIDDALAAAITGLRTFSWRELQPEHPEIINALLEMEGGEIFADEYAYLVSHSWLAVLERTQAWVGALEEAGRHGIETLEAFARAGVTRYDVAEHKVAAFIKHARGKLPQPVVDGLKDLQELDERLMNAAKRPMLVVGGAAAGVVLQLIPQLAGLTIAASVISAGLAIIAGDP
jgi:hypothetical protein